MTTYTWQIVELKKNSFDKRVATDPKTLYSYRLLNVENDGITGSDMYYSEVVLLMSYFKVNTVPELLMKTFTSEHIYASSALDLLFTQIRHNGEYKAPSAEELRIRAATALAKFQVPDFSDVDCATVSNVFQEPWETGYVSQQWLTAFKALIFGLSGGNVTLSEGNIDDFSVRYMGPALYMKLVSRDKVQKVIFGPYSTPFEFEK